MSYRSPKTEKAARMDAEGNYNESLILLSKAAKEGDQYARTQLGKRLLVGDRASVNRWRLSVDLWTLEVARLLTGNPAARAGDGIAWVQGLCADLGVPPLRAYGITEADVPLLVEKTAAASSTKANPIALTKEELTQILERAL